jgi:signal transduction histidine kinase
LSDIQAPLFAWLVLVLSLLLLVGTLTAPYSTLANYSSILLGSNTKTFVATVVGAFLFFMMLAWFKVFLDTLLIISSAILARIDFQSAGFTEGQAFIVTSIFSILGVALGAFAHTGVVQQLW